MFLLAGFYCMSKHSGEKGKREIVLFKQIPRSRAYESCFACQHLKVRPASRILCVCVWGGGGGANEAKVDQTTEKYFLLSNPYI